MKMYKRIAAAEVKGAFDKIRPVKVTSAGTKLYGATYQGRPVLVSIPENE